MQIMRSKVGKNMKTEKEMIEEINKLKEKINFYENLFKKGEISQATLNVQTYDTHIELDTLKWVLNKEG